MDNPIQKTESAMKVFIDSIRFVRYGYHIRK